MNEDATGKIRAMVSRLDPDMRNAISTYIRVGMEWAYRDAARICRNEGEFWQKATPKIISPVACAAAECAEKIEARLK